MSFPPLPSWEAAHPLVVHMPIGLLMVSTLLVLIGAAPRVPAGFRWATLLVLGLGTLGAFVATRTGEEAEAVAEYDSEEAGDLLMEHGELAEFARNVYLGITLAYAGLLAWQWRSAAARKGSVHYPAHLLVFAALAYASIPLANAGHMGGQLVHQYGIHAPMAPEAEEAAEEESGVDESLDAGTAAPLESEAPLESDATNE